MAFVVSSWEFFEIFFSLWISQPLPVKRQRSGCVIIDRKKIFKKKFF